MARSGFFLGSVVRSLGFARVRICEHIFEATPQHERIYSMGGNCMKEVQNRTIMQLNFCTTGWLPHEMVCESCASVLLLANKVTLAIEFVSSQHRYLE